MEFSSTTKPGQEKSVATSTTCCAEVVKDINRQVATVNAHKGGQWDFMCMQVWITNLVRGQDY